MPLLGRRRKTFVVPAPARGAGPMGVTGEGVLPLRPARKGILTSCANPGCASGWLHLWRSRSTPVFEDGWNCSWECTEARVQRAIGRELDDRLSQETSHRHRIPLGLVMLDQGWISPRQLRQALDAQKATGAGRLGQWLVRQQGVSEQMVTRALGLQWSCPVLSIEFHDPEAFAPLIPRFFLDAFGALPLRIAGGRVLYLGFEGRPDPVLALAVERMTGLRAECGIVRESEFRSARERMLEARFPTVELVEAASAPAAARALAKSIERAKPIESRLVRVHDCLWLRMWRRTQAGPAPDARWVQDSICSVGVQF